MSDLFTLDKSGIPILPGDILKAFHFVGARGRRHYMFKQALEYYPLTCSPGRRLKISHLNRIGDEPLTHDHWYCEAAENKRLFGYEIVQSVKCDHESRERPSTDRDGGGDNG